MAWCHQAPNHYLSQCWPRSVSPYGITRPQGVNSTTIWSVCQPWTLSLMLWSMRSHSVGLWNGEGLGPQGIGCLRRILLAGSKAKGSFHSSHFRSLYQTKFHSAINQVVFINITIKFWVISIWFIWHVQDTGMIRLISLNLYYSYWKWV